MCECVLEGVRCVLCGVPSVLLLCYSSVAPNALHATHFDHCIVAIPACSHFVFLVRGLRVEQLKCISYAGWVRVWYVLKCIKMIGI